jgi:hypothetical protein
MTVKATGSSFADASLVLENYNTTDRTYLAHTGGKFYLSNDGSTTHMLVDASGNVGIGTSSPASQLDILGSSSRIRLDGSAAAFQILSRNTVDSATNPIIFDADTYTFNRAGSTQAVIDSSGNVGIGVVPASGWSTSPYNVLDINTSSVAASSTTLAASLNAYNDGSAWRYKGTGAASQYYQASGNHVWQTAASGTAGNTISFSEAMRIDASGNVGIGVVPNGTYSKLQVKAVATSYVADFIGNVSGDSQLTFWNSNQTAVVSFIENQAAGAHMSIVAGSGRSLKLGAGGTAGQVLLDASGNLLVGRTDAQTADNTAGIYLFPEGGLGAQRDSAASLFINRFGTDGDIAVFRKQGTTVGSVSVTGSATTYNTSSDQRLKENIVDAPSASDDIDAIQVRSFDWKADGSHQKYGMVAQELVTVAPEAVSGDADSEEMMGVDYSKLVPMMLKEIQSLRARVSELES